MLYRVTFSGMGESEQGSSNSNSTAKTASSRAALSAGTEQASGLPREYEMVKAARQNWLSTVALTSIGPLSGKIATAEGVLKMGALWSLLTTATWR